MVPTALLADVPIFALRRLGSAHPSVPSVAGIFRFGIQFRRFTFLPTLSGITCANRVEPEELQVFVFGEIGEKKVSSFSDMDMDCLVKEENVGVVFD
jgi:hypothetical protein